MVREDISIDMDEDNLSRQIDEVEAVASIYGPDWLVVDEASRVYSITIKSGEDSALVKLKLQITLHPDYPSSAPPQYELHAPWLRGQDRQMIQNVLEEIYVENIGESIIFLWVEKLREILSEQAVELPSANSSTESCSKVDDSIEEAIESLDVKGSSRSGKPVPKGIECPEIFHGEPVMDRKSTFQGHLAKVIHKEQVDLVMDQLLENKKIANATHNIIAYRICKEDPNPIYYTGCEDDGETHAGSRLLHLLKLMNAENVLVVISRWYGGIHLGPDRFKHINNCARELLEEHGFRQDGDEKKGPRSGQKKR